MMKHLSIVISVAVVVCLVACGCDDCPTCPEVPTETEKHYKVYVVVTDGIEHGVWLYTLDIPADTIIDSVSLNTNPIQIHATPSGEKLYMPNIGPYHTVVYNTSDLSVDTTLDVIGDLFFDASRNLGILVDGYGVHVFDPDSYEFTGHVQFACNYAFECIDTINGLVYGSEYDSVIHIIDYVNLEVADSLVIGGVAVSSMLVVPEYDRLYFLSGGAFIYDLIAREVIQVLPQTQPYGNFARSNDGKFVYKCDPGRLFSGQYGSNLIWVYSVPDDAVISYYSTIVGGTSVDVAAMAITPDGNNLLATGSMDLALLRYDLNTGLATNV
ncbi:MAG: hypothetical protein KAT79_01445, partial [candidate division Zixibacteria bacterium]|nr:hypothetical protein [candidate division Zixibacteria bacterium]